MTLPYDLAPVIDQLYVETAVSAPTINRPIVPLGSLLRNLGLVGVEITGLTVSTASSFLLKRGGAVEPLLSITDSALAGFLCFVPDYGGCVFVERHDIFARRRFSVAHELGHYLLHFQPRLLEAADFDQPMMDAFPFTTSDNLDPDTLPLGQMALPGLETTGPVFEQMEREANAFAANLLMPGDVVMGLCARYQPHLTGSDLAARLAGDLLVSRAAIRWRLRRLGITMKPEPQLN